jgi:hypothetical protein
LAGVTCGRFVCVGDVDGADGAETMTLADVRGSFDDIIYIGADADTVEALGAHLGNRGIMNVVMAGRRFTRDVSIDAGRIHYDLIRYVGTTGSDIAQGYAWLPTTYELRRSDRVAVIGAAGPMGLMHAVRAATSGVPGVSLVAADVDDDRLVRLRAILEPIAAASGVPTAVVNSRLNPLEAAAFTYVALMVPSPQLLRQAIDLVASDAIVNAFAGFAVGTSVPLDFNDLVAKRTFIVGTSGSRIKDMKVVLDRVEAGIVDTNISLDAITGMAGVTDAIASVNDRTSQGKIMVYPWLHDLGLVRLEEIPRKLPELGAHLVNGQWTKQAEEALRAMV